MNNPLSCIDIVSLKGSMVHSNGWCYLKPAQISNLMLLPRLVQLVGFWMVLIGEGQTRIRHGGNNQLCFRIRPINAWLSPSPPRPQQNHRLPDRGYHVPR
jgi:hypothetical protein